MFPAGMLLRKIRDSLGLTMRDVEAASAIISRQHSSEEYLIPPSRLSDIETKGVVPSVFRFYSLAAIYHRPAGDLLQFYRVDLQQTIADWDTSRPPQSHVVELQSEQHECKMPVKLDPGFDLRETSDLGRMIQQSRRIHLLLVHDPAQLADPATAPSFSGDGTSSQTSARGRSDWASGRCRYEGWERSLL